jgi:hypothetical protein
VIATDFGAEVARYLQAGGEVASELTVPGGARLCYIDTRGTLPGFIEVIEGTETIVTLFAGLARASADWDGSESIRVIA